MSADRLSSWKEIAAHLHTTTRTVMRWETSGLPVHRLQTGKRATVYAFKSELDAWVAERSSAPDFDWSPVEEPEEAAAETTFRRPRRWLWAAALAAGAAVVALGAYLVERGPQIVPGEEPIRLTNSPGLERSPALSPDGSQVAYVRMRPGAADFDVYVLDLNTRESRPLAAGPNNEFAPAWSPDGKSILYVREKLGTERIPGGMPTELSSTGLVPPEARGLFRLDVETGTRTRLTRTENPGWGDTEPALSEDGRFLAFVRRIEPFYSELFLMDLESPGAKPRQLTHFGKWVMTPRFTGEGKILFSAGEFGADRAIWRASVEGGEPEIVLRPPRNVYEFDVTPDGVLIVTQARVRSEIWGLTVGPSPLQAARYVSSEGMDKLPALSADGTKMAFFSDRGESTEIWLSGSDGSNPHPLTVGAGEGEASLDWSPDGRTLVTTLRRGAGRNVFLVNADNGELTPLTDGPFEDRHARWGPDGKWVYFSSEREIGTRRIYRVPAEGGETEPLLKGHSMDFSADGDHVLYMPSNRRLSALVNGESVPLTRIVEPQAFAPARGGFFMLNPAGLNRVGIEFASFQGNLKRAFVHVPDSRRDIAASQDGKLLRWSQAAQPEGDLVMLRMD